ncbi:hypothetical protein QUF64_01965 [Anaerolineales bacterium HSG6]|nr:hypothetical protein [Anaerolineales bacterium HSG6]
MTAYTTIELPTQLYTELQALAESKQTTPVDLIARLITLLQQSLPSQEKTALESETLLQSFEPLIRRVVREELAMIGQAEPETFDLTPDMPLYEDMVELSERKSRDEIELYSHQEVWNE